MQMLATGDMQMIQLVNTLPSAKTTRSAPPHSQLSTPLIPPPPDPPHTAYRKLMTRRRQLAVLAAQLHELTTEEEREDYPFFDHLQDLINDMEEGE